MSPSEPMTAFTDFVLAGVYLGCTVALVRKARAAQQTTLWLAVAAFAALVAGAALGGVHHWTLSDGTWKATVLSIGFVSLFMIASAAYMALEGMARWPILSVAIAQFLAYEIWMVVHDNPRFLYVIWDYASAMLLVLGLYAWAAAKGRTRSGRWMVAAIAVTFAASGIQASGFTLHRHFNHNDLYHVIQMGAAWLFYRGFRDSHDWSAQTGLSTAETRH